jgi:L-glutamine-phosphate cytidylyltransferase
MDQKMINTDYTAVVLAAGYGSRISDMTDKPKCLLILEGKTLLERNFEIWKNLGIKRVHLVLGYKKELIVEIAEKYKRDFDFSFYINEDFEKQGNTFSLYLGIKEIEGACLIFDADLVYEEEILEEFLSNKKGSEILVGEGSLSDIECAKTLVDEYGFARMTVDKRAVTEEELQKYRFAGEAIGILKFSKEKTSSLADLASSFLTKQSNLILNWEHLLNDFLVLNDVGVHKFKQGKWFEIDTPEDFKEAQILFKG